VAEETFQIAQNNPPFLIFSSDVTIHSLSACEDGCVMLACKQPSS
jgi:hypothetical protein